MSAQYRTVALPDGRSLEVLDEGEGDRALVFLWGTPGAAIPDEGFARLAATYGLRVLQPNRPGYGQSDPQPGRRIVDLAADLDVVLQQLGLSDAVVMGGSGGGPHALACAARLPQCRAAAVLVSPAPRDAEGLDFYDGMAASNQEEWRLADEGEAAVRPYLERTAALATGEEFLAQFDDAISEADRAAFTSPARHQRQAKAVERGIEGWLEDDLAMTTPWGFGLDEVRTPTAFWAGKQDQFVSYRHSMWMSERVADSDLHLLGDEGHVSLRLHHMDLMVTDLLRRAGWPLTTAPTEETT